MTLLFQAMQPNSNGKVMSDEISRLDPWGIGMMVIGMLIVFCSLWMLYILFFNISRLLQKRNRPKVDTVSQSPITLEASNAVSSEVAAAIGIALQLYFDEQHDNEKAILTIQRVARSYSPWSSKLYGLRNHPRQ